MMTSAQVVETSVTTTDNSPSQDYTHLDNQTTLLHVTPRFKPFTVLISQIRNHFSQKYLLEKNIKTFNAIELFTWLKIFNHHSDD